jgi:hypothetical protein
MGLFMLLAVTPASAGAANDGVRIRSEQMIAVPVDNELKIFDSFDLDAPAGAPVTLHLPKGHRDVRVMTEQASGYRASADGITWPGGLPTGVTSVAVTYTLPFENGRTDIDFSQPYDVDAVVLLIPEGRTALIAQGLFPVTQVVELEGMKFRRFTKPDLLAGVPWTATVQAIPQAGQTISGSIPVPAGLPVIGAGYKYTEFKAFVNLLLVLFVVVLGIMGLRKRRERIAGLLSDIHEQLVEQWARLELERRSGTVPEEEYRRRRGHLLRRLLAVEHQQRGMGSRD